VYASKPRGGRKVFPNGTVIVKSVAEPGVRGTPKQVAVMRKVNSLLYESTDSDKFVTAFYGVLDLKSRVLTFANAGHNPPMLLRRDGTSEHLHEGGVALVSDWVETLPGSCP